MNHVVKQRGFWARLNYALSEVPFVFIILAGSLFFAIAIMIKELQKGIIFGDTLQFLKSGPFFSFLAALLVFIVSVYAIRLAMKEY